MMVAQADEIDALGQQLDGLRLLKGSEADITTDGSLALEDDALTKLESGGGIRPHAVRYFGGVTDRAHHPGAGPSVRSRHRPSDRSSHRRARAVRGGRRARHPVLE